MRSCFRDEPLYIVLPYFNYCNYKSRRRLFVDFVARSKFETGIKIIVVEAIGPAPLPTLPVWKHIKVPSSHPVWIKENLINIGETHLPRDWKYMAWIDADIVFLNSHWVAETKETLETLDIVQLFQSAVNLGPKGETIKVDKSFGYMHSQSGTEYTATDKYGFWHPGYAWACTHTAWRQMGKLIDWAILGSADRHMALAWIGKGSFSRPGNVNENYKRLIDIFQKNCAGIKLGNVNGSILHLWHGSLENRKYKERWNILTSKNFDPMADIGLTDDGVLRLTASGQRLEPELKKYFLERYEDS